MSKRKEQRKKIFEIFARNLEWVKEHPEIRFEPSFENGYICPLCFDVFLEKDLSDNVENPLTIEDVPPVSLGGKPLTLTCKKCNSKSGHILDNHLLLRLLETDFNLFLPNSKIKTTFELKDSKVNGAIEFDDKGVMKIDLQTSRCNPAHAKKFMHNLIPPQTMHNPIFLDFDEVFDQRLKSETFTIQKPNRSNERRAEIALLRIAYLLAYSTFGNGFYINGGLYKVREQILHPDKEILPKVFWINYEFPEQMAGMNIIKEPKELRCFLIIFYLTTKSKRRQYAVALPGPSTPGIKIYENIENLLCKSGTGFVNTEIEHLVERDFLKTKDLTFTSSYYWQKMASG